MADPTLRVKQTLDNSQFKKGLKDSQKQASLLQTSMKAIGGAIAGAFAVGAIVSYTKEAMNLAGKLQGVREAFFRISDAATLEKLKEATRGTVSELELMKNAVKANNFKIPLEQLATFFEFATKRAAQTGESVQYLVESIILGIGRKSPLILDNLGISAIELRKKLKGVGMESASVGDVTKAMGEIIEDEMVRMGDVAETAAQRMEKLKATSEDMQTAWGELANTFSEMVAPALTSLAKGMKDALEGSQALTDSKSLSWWDKLKVTLAMATGSYKAVGRELGDNIDPAMEETTEKLGNLNEVLEDNTDNLEADTKAAEDAAESFRKAQQEMRKLNEESMKKISGGLQPVTTSEMGGAGLSDNQQKILAAFEQVANTRITGFQVATEDVKDFDMALKNNFEGLQTWSDSYEKFYVDVAAISDAINETLRNVALTVVDTMATMLEAMVAGEKMDFGATLLSAIGGFMKQLGEAMITIGAIGELFDTAIKSMQWYVALGAGVALVAAGAVLSGVAKKGVGMAEGGVVPGGYPGDTYPAMLSSGEVVVPPGKLDSVIGKGGQTVRVVGQIRGQDIHFVNEKQTSKLNRYR